jgi:hypothetical protein
MKKLCLALIFLVVFGALTPLFAQKISPGHESEYYYVNVLVEKIYPSRAGYMVVYRKGGINQTGRVYLPNEWFIEAGGKAELINLPSGQNWPSMTVYYKAGEFSHVRLFVHRWTGHATWGNLPQTANIDDRFEGVESLTLEF